MDDPRNTDHAWIESEAYNVHDDTGIFAKAELMETTNDPVVSEVTWAVAHRDLKLFVDHRALVKTVVDLKGAFW